jgi:hypothetical protein
MQVSFSSSPRSLIMSYLKRRLRKTKPFALGCMFVFNLTYLFKAFVDTESLVLELLHIVLLVMVSLVAKEFWKMCWQLVPWYSFGNSFFFRTLKNIELIFKMHFQKLS